MKIRSSIKKMCGACRIIKRGKHNYVYCEKHPRHKQRQGFSTLIPSAMTTAMPFAQALSAQMRAPLVHAASAWRPVESLRALLQRSL